MNCIHTVCMQNSLNATCSNTGQLLEKPADLASLDGEIQKERETVSVSGAPELRVEWISERLFRFVHVPPLFVCHPVPWPELKGHLGAPQSFLNHVCECWYVKSGSAEGAQGRFTPHDQERWRPFPRQPIFPSLCSPPLLPPLRQCWHRSSLISPEPTGLFFHLRIPPSRHRGRSAFHIFCLFKSLAAFQSVHFLPLRRRAVSLSWPRLLSLSTPTAVWWNLTERHLASASPASSVPAGVSSSSQCDWTDGEKN